MGERGVIKRGLAAAKCCHSDTSGHPSPAGWYKHTQKNIVFPYVFRYDFPHAAVSAGSVIYYVLLCRYWWITRIFSFTKKSYLHRAQWRIFKILFLSFTCGDIGVATVTNMVFLFFVRILTFWNRKYKYYCLYFSFITLHLRFITFLWQVFCDRWPLNCTILLFRKWI